MALTQKRLRELLKYNPETGVWVWIVNMRSIKKGDVAGSVKQQGYRIIKIDCKAYRSSRLAFFYMEGYFPENFVDHINRIRDDDKWENLREVSRQCNGRNCNIQKRSTSGITGVCWDKLKNKWRADVGINGKTIYLGIFTNKLDAVKARWNAEVKYNYPNCNTTSTAYNYILRNRVHNEWLD